MKKSKYFMLSQDVEIPILYFLWRVKVASTSALFFRFEKDFSWKAKTAYQRLFILKKKGCINTKSDESGNFKVWTLTAKGFQAIKTKLLALKEEGYASESLTHDLFVLATHYGEWISRSDTKDVRFLTEQELRRIESSDLPAWAQTLQSHKPDGVWYFPETINKNTVALEVELSRKRQTEYESLGLFYSEEANVHSVIWIVQSQGHANTMRSAFQQKTISYRDIHNFVLVDDLKKMGWASQIFLGPNQNSTLRNFLESMRHSKPIARPMQFHSNGYVGKILDFRVKSFNSSTYAPNTKS